MTTDRERSPVRFATPYLEVQAQPTSRLERTIPRELAQARLAAKRKKRNRGKQPPSMAAGAVEKNHVTGLGGGQA